MRIITQLLYINLKMKTGLIDVFYNNKVGP